MRLEGIAKGSMKSRGGCLGHGKGQDGKEQRPAYLQAKKNPEIRTFVGLPGFEDGGSCGIRTYDQLVKSQLLYQLS